jgi:hypothetical protein
MAVPFLILIWLSLWFNLFCPWWMPPSSCRLDMAGSISDSSYFLLPIWRICLWSSLQFASWRWAMKMWFHQI